MRLSRALALAAMLGLSASVALADWSAALTISDADRPLVAGAVYFWHEVPATADIEQASAPATAGKYRPLATETTFDLKPRDRLWMRVDLDRASASGEHWIAWIPLPLVDSVTMYQRTPQGNWRAQKAGDRVAVADWPEPGRYPRFHFELPSGKSSIYLQIQGSTPISLPLHIGTEVTAQASDRLGFLGLGLIVGVLLTLVLACFATAYTYNDRLYLLYGIYLLLMTLAVSAYTGLAGYLLWDHSPLWADASQGMLAMLTAGCTLYFIEALLGGRQFARRQSAALLAIGTMALPFASIYYFVSRSTGVVMLGVYMISIASIGLSLAMRAWRQGDRVGIWVFLAYAPLVAAVLSAIARTYGWIGMSWLVQYGVVIALLVEAPMMMVALHVRSRERHDIRTREQAMSTQDALTGLLKEHIFDDRIQQTTTRSVKRREDAAVLLISLVNYKAIAAAHSLPVAEQSVLRAVIKLRKVLRDVENVARVGTSHFGVILEGESSRDRITEVGARLIAQGLMPLPGLVPEVILQFHVAAAVLREIPGVELDVKKSLQGLLSTMSPRTRRPIRFLEIAPVSDVLAQQAPPDRLSVLERLTAQVSQADRGELASVFPSTLPRQTSFSDSSGLGWESTGQHEATDQNGDSVVPPR